MKQLFTHLIFTVAILYCTNTNAQAPTVKAVPANRITYDGANLNVLVNPNNDSTTISFEYGLTTSYGATASVSGKSNGNTTLFKTKSITGLNPGKTYHYRAKAVNSSGTTYGSDRVFAAGSNFSKSADAYHTITVGDEGIVYAFGINNYRQLGDNTTTNRATPIQVLKGAYSGTTYLGDNANNPIISVAGGEYHSIALAADGSVYAFGYNGHGQLGDNTTTDRATPIKVLKGAYSGTTYLGDNANNPIISFMAGQNHSIAIAADGSVYAFGLNVWGQLGDNTTTSRATPINVLKGAYSGTTYLGDNANNPIISLAAGSDHTTALAADGSVYAFGWNAYGQLGDNTTTSRATPIKVLKGAYSGTAYLGDNANNPIISVVDGWAQSIALAADGSVYAFGLNNYGQLGDNTTTDRATPIQVLKGAYSGTTYLGDNANNPIISFMAGENHNIALAADGSVYAFGRNNYGQLGDNTTTNRATPINVLKGAYSGTTYLGDNVNNPIISFAGGYKHNIAIAADGSVYAFGYNGYGQLGDNTTADRATPIQVLGVGGTGFLDLIATPTVKAVPANRVTYYGANLNALVNPNNDSTTISFEYGLTTSYGSTANVSGKFKDSIYLFKTIAITGLTPGKTYHYRAKAVNSSGTTYGSDRVFAAGSNFSKSSHGLHTITVGDEGIVYAFGSNNYGELGDNTTTNRATPIQVLKGAYSGTTYLGDNANNPIISVAASQDHSLALAADGSVYAFGRNAFYQLGDNTNTDRATPIYVLKGAYSGTTYLGDNANNPIISVVAGAAHSIALAADGTLYAFGHNGYGQLGDSTTTYRATPIKVLKGAYSGTTCLGDNANNPITSIAAGGAHSIALAADGSVYAFGDNGYGALGDNTTTTRSTPIKVLKGAYSGTTYMGDNANNPIISVSAGAKHSIALAADGTVYAFGLNGYGQLGDNTTTNRATPIQVLKGAYSGTTYLGDNANNAIISVVAGCTSSIALAADGTVYTFGSNAYGELGDNTTTDRATPIQVLKGAYSGTNYLGDNANNPIVSVVIELTHSIALAADGTVYTFGGNGYGQLGDSTSLDRATPIQVLGVGATGFLDLIGGCKTNAGTDKSICAGSSTSIGTTAVSGHSYKWTSSPTGYSSTNATNSVTPSTTTIYIVRDSVNSSGCIAFDSITVTVNPPPTANAGTDKSICAGNTATIGDTTVSGHSYKWTSSPSGYSSTTAINTVAPTTTTTYIVRDSINGSACIAYDSVTVTVNPLPTAKAGTDKSVCAGNSASIGDTAVSGHSYKWTSSPSGYSSTTAINTVAPTTTTIYIVRDSINASGCIASDSVTVTVNPVPTPNAGSDKSICAGSSASIGSAAVSGHSYMWTSSPSGYSSTTATNTVTPGTTTIYIVRDSIDASGCIASDSVTVTVNPLPTPNAGADKSICAGSSAAIGDTAVSGHSYMWTSSPSGYSSTTATNTVTPGTTTIYIVRDSIDASGCIASDSITVTVNPLPTPNAGSDKSICAGSSASIGSAAVSGHSYMWTSSPSGYSSTTATNTVTPGTTTIYIVRDSIDASGCIASDSVTVTVNPLPTPNAGADKSICAGSSAAIGDTAVSGHSYMWTSSPSGYSSTTATNTVTPGTTTIYIVRDSIDASGCIASDSVTVTVNPLPTPNAGADKSICAGSSAAIGDTAVSGHSYMWTSSPSGYSSTTATNTVTPGTTTIYIVRDSINASGCITSDSVTITVNPLPAANVGSSKTICKGDSTSIGANAVSGNTYSWSSSPTGFTSTNSNPTVTPLINTIYYLTENNTATGCTKSDSVSILVNRTLNTITKTACNNYTFKGNALTNSGTYYDTLKNSLGCDSIITLNLTIMQSTYNTITKTACNKYTFGGNSLTNSGVYYDTLTNAVGCDSIITLNLTINNSTGITIFDTACASYTFKGNTITSSGIYYDTLSNVSSCDSVVALHLIIQPTNFSLAFTQNTQVFTTPPFDVLFLNTTPSKNSYTFTWFFGDGTYYTGTNPPKHSYQANGTYDVTLIAQNNATGCTDTLYKQGWILCSGGITCTHTAQIIQTNIAKKCNGDSIYLSCISDTSYTYQWLYNGIKMQGATDSFIYAKTAGQYAVIVTDSFCPLTSTQVTIGFYPLATKPTISHNGSLVFCTGGSVELYVNNIYNTYSWNTGSQTYHTYVSNSGTYFVSVNDSNGCQAQSDTFSLNASFISPPPICLVSVDSATNKNIVIWEKANAGSIDSFVILKETSQANIYNIIGKLPYGAFSTFVDTASNPDVQANRYKLQAIDTCGIITLPSDYHKTIHLTINKGQGTNWNLIWSHYEGISFSSYNIYRGSSSTTMGLLTAIASNLNSYTDVNPPTGNLFYQIEVVNPQGCTPSQKTNSYSSSLSNIADINNIGFAFIYNTKYNVFPNPTNSQLTIQSTKKLSNTTIKLYNITGQLITQKTNLSGDNFTVDLADYAKGIYIFEISSLEGVERVKVVKE